MRLPLAFAALLFALPVASRADSADACKRLSEAALITNTKTLLIAVEGLFSFNSVSTERAYDYRCTLVRGLGGQRPSVGMGGYVLKNLVVPAIEKYKNRLQVVVVSQAGAENKDSKAYHCAKAWMEESRAAGRRVILLGHSFGGYAVTKLAENLGSTPIAGVVTIDPRHRVPTQPAMFRRGKVARWENFYQRSAGLPGYKIHGADTNSRLSGRGHTGLPGHPAVKAALERLIGEAPGPSVVAGDISDCRPASPSLARGLFTRQGMAGNDRMRSLGDVSGTRTGGLLSFLFPSRRGGSDAAGRRETGPVPGAPEPARLASINDNRAFTYRGFGGREFTLPQWWEGRSTMGKRPEPNAPGAASVYGAREKAVPEALAAAYPDAADFDAQDPAAFIGLPGSEDLQRGSASGAEDEERVALQAEQLYHAGASTGSGEHDGYAPSAATGASAVVKGLLRQTASAENASLFERVNRATRRHFP